MNAEQSSPESPTAQSLDLYPAFVAELVGKSDLVWVHADDRGARPVWTVWHDGAIALVTDGLEQPNPGLRDGNGAVVVLRSHEERSRQLTIGVTVEELVAGSAAWDAAVKTLHPKRLNAPDGERQPERWARESTIWLLHPTGDIKERPGDYSDDAHRAEPLPTNATTLNRTPYHAGRATKKRRRR
ncbi:MAG TPA: hypothetical protein VFX15_13950 [Actinomycetes bacterium]|nr:hypothetical protein [Actinomycetes bacterium]